MTCSDFTACSVSMKTRWPWREVGETPEALDLAALVERCTSLSGLLHEMRSWPRCRPLSLARGAIRAVEMHALPDGDWVPLLDSVTHVQTSVPAVCAALARDDRSFLVEDAACEAAVRARSAHARVVQRRASGAQAGSRYRAHPAIDDQAFMPLAQLSSTTWFCWDRDLDRAVTVAEGDRVFSRLAGPVGPMPYESEHPSEPEWHATATGRGWAAAVHMERRARTHVLVAPGRFALMRGTDPAPSTSDMIWWWRHRNQASDLGFATLPADHFDPHELVGAVVSEDGHVQVGAAGRYCAMRWRQGELTYLTAPHTLFYAEGFPASADAEFVHRAKNMILRTVDATRRTLDLSEHVLAPGDRLVLLDPCVMDKLGAEAVAACIGAADLRAGMDVLRQLLQEEELGEAVLVLEHGATGAVMGAPLELAFELDGTAAPDPSLDADEALDAAEHTWRLYRDVTVEARPAPYSACALEWVSAVRSADASVLEPHDGDLLEIVWTRGRSIYFTWRAAFHPVHDGPTALATREDRRPVAVGRLRFPEDAPAMRAVLERATTFTGLADVARRAGHENLAWYLEVLERHRRGELCGTLQAATEHVSKAARVACAELGASGPVSPHRVSSVEVWRSPHLYHGCQVELRTLVTERFEGMSVAGAWWSPYRPSVPADARGGRHYMEVRARWDSIRGGYGHMAGWAAQASGLATPIALPQRPRTIAAHTCATARPGVPLMVTATLRRRVVSWGWSLNDSYAHQPIAVAPGIEWPASPSQCEIEVVIVREGRLVVPLEVRAIRNLTPLPFAPWRAGAAQDECVRVAGRVSADGHGFVIQADDGTRIALRDLVDTTRALLANHVGLRVEIEGELGYRGESLAVYRLAG